MAILMDDQFIKCSKCGSETFKEEELFRIKKNSKEPKKDSLGTATVCANCNQVLKIKAR